MSLIGFLLLLVVAAVVGSLGQAVAGFSRGGLLMAIVVGFIGAYIGMWLAGELNLPHFLVLNIEGQPFPIVWSVIGAALFSLLLALIFRGGRMYRHRHYHYR